MMHGKKGILKQGRIDKFETKDISFVRRMRLLADMKMIVYCTEKDLSSLERDDIDKVIKYTNTVLSPRSKRDFILDIKHLWRVLFPEKDQKGRPDETITPYVVRHLNGT